MSLRKAIASFRAELFDRRVKNSMSTPLGQQFLRYGNRNLMAADMSQVVISDEDIYTGYMYAAVTKRARKTAQVAVDCVKTRANEAAVKAAQKAGKDLVHPYMAKLKSSPTFTDGQLWTAFSTYVDLEGVYYLLAIRTVGEKKVGNVQEFKLLNPYEVARVKDLDSLQVQGYLEQRGGFRREIPKEMIIETRILNPFSEDKTFSMADAAKESAFTLSQADDYTRSSLKHNVNASGIVSTDLVLDPDQMKNFKARVMDGNKREPIFTDAAGGVKYTDMQIQLDKSALKDINQINVEKTLVVTGTSKTTLGVEVSGVTRDTSETQSELFVTGEIMPQIQLLIDALNQDYRNSYPEDYAKYGYELYLDNPLGADHEAELQDISVRDKSFDLQQKLVAAGYPLDKATDYATGKISQEDLGEPEKPKTPEVKPEPAAEKPEAANAKNAVDTTQVLIEAQASTLQNTVVQIEAQVAAAVSKKVTNAYDSQSDIISDQDRKESERELVTALALFYAAILPLQAGMTMAKRQKEYGKLGTFKLTPEVSQTINQSAKRASASHMDTILQDLLEAVQVAEIAGGDVSAVVEAVQKAYPEESAQAIQSNLKTAAEKASRDTTKQAERVKETAANLGKKYTKADDEELFKAVRKAALDGAEHDELVRAIRSEYADISKNRAKAIARTETNRAFSTSQYEADKQFLAQNDLEGQAYKLWVTRSPNPCPFCMAQAARGPIPFNTNFASIGDVLSAKVTKEDGSISVRQMQVTYADLEAGSAHVNCSCSYQLIIGA